MDSVIYPEKSIIVQKNEIPNFIGFIYDGKVKEIFQDGKFKIYKGGDVFNR